jgi:SAM-dependent methyltransferase
VHRCDCEHGADSHANAYTVANASADTGRHANADTHSDTYGNGTAYAVSNGYAYTSADYSNPFPLAVAYAHTSPDRHSDAFTDADSNALSYTDSDSDMTAEHELAKYKGIYSGENPRYRGYGSSNHGARALPIVEKWMPESLLDVGCGHNHFVKSVLALAQPPRVATGVDFACPGADILADATALPFEAKQFDTLTAFDMLEHVLPEQVDTVLSEFARVSRRFIFSISYVPSVIKWNGENLHPTVQPESWWLRRIMKAGGAFIKKEGHYITGEWQPALKIAPDARVILVGNGPSLRECLAAEIDSFDEVVRFNTFHVEPPFCDYAGTKTTLWSTFGRGTLPACDQRPERILYIHGETGFPAYPAPEIYRLPRHLYNDTRAMVQLGVKQAGRDPEPILATSGMQVAIFLLDVVGVNKITLAGFDHFRKVKEGGCGNEHHHWQAQAFGKPKEHDGEVEAAIFNELRHAGRVEYL